MNRKNANWKNTTMPLATSAFCAARTSRVDISRCTISWSTPCEAIASRMPPKNAARNGKPPVSGSEEKSNSWNFDASTASPNHPDGSAPASATTTMTPPRTYQSIWIASTHTTARTPPTNV